MNTKTNCWICGKEYVDHTKENWKKCSVENARRGEVIKKLDAMVNA